MWHPPEGSSKKYHVLSVGHIRNAPWIFSLLVVHIRKYAPLIICGPHLGPTSYAEWPSDTTTSCASTLKSDIIEAWKRRKKKNHRKEAWKRRKKRRQLKLDRLKPVPH
jgi:hypothetical protein